MALTIEVTEWTVLLGLILIGILNGIGTAIGNIITKKYIEPHITRDKTTDVKHETP